MVQASTDSTIKCVKQWREIVIKQLPFRELKKTLPLSLNNTWISKSFTVLKILMIFSFIREQDDVLTIMIKSEINQILATQKEDP